MKRTKFWYVPASRLHENGVQNNTFWKWAPEWSTFETLRSLFPCKRAKSILFKKGVTGACARWLQHLYTHHRLVTWQCELQCFWCLVLPCKWRSLLKRFPLNAVLFDNKNCKMFLRKPGLSLCLNSLSGSGSITIHWEVKETWPAQYFRRNNDYC